MPAQDTAVYQQVTSHSGKTCLSLLVPALPPSPGRKEEAQEQAPLQGRTQVQYCKRSLTHAAIGAVIHGYSRRRPACIQVRSLTLSGEGQASVPPLSP